MKKQILFHVFVLTFLTSCSGVEFNPAASAANLNNRASLTPSVTPLPHGPDPVCGDPDQPPHNVWVQIGEQNFPCATKCPDGTRLQCKQMAEKELRCIEGYPQETGNSRMVGQPEPVGTCPILPKDCGNHPNLSKWWESTGTVSRVCEICSDGSNHNCLKQVESEMSCSDGNIASTGQVRDGAFIEYQNECLPPPPKACGDHAHGSNWWDEVSTSQEACQTCWDGSKLNCEYAVEGQKTCTDGTVASSGQTRKGRLIQTIGKCPVQPKNCGDHAHGTSWWDEVSTTQQACQTCWDGSKLNCEYAVEGQKTCTDGTIASGPTRQGRLIQTIGKCPVQPKNCGDLAHGASEWRVNGQGAPYNCETCWDGSSRKCVKAKEEQVRCDDGVLNLTGQVRDGAFIGYLNSCPVKPKDCGNVAHGASEWRVNGQGAPYDCEVCIDGSTRKCVKAKEEQVRCDDGILGLTGQVRDGAFIGYLNNCPTNIVERKESVTVSAAGGKADVLFILDTTPAMFLSLNNLATKFDKLISSWTNIDWQIAITNSKVEKSAFDPYVLQGKFMELQKNDMTKKVEYILKPGYFAEDWFYRTMSRDPSDNGCESQPYCMTDVSEPMRALKAAIDKRDSGVNKGFFREKSKLVVVMISSGDERRVGATDKKATKPDEAINYFKSKLGTRMDGMIGMSVVIKSGDAACLKKYSSIFELGDGGHYAPMLTEFASKTGGLTASLCDKDYGSSLSKLSESVRQLVESITLKEVPMPNTLQVTFTPQVQATWVLQGNKVIFDRPIPKGTRIDVKYLVKTP